MFVVLTNQKLLYLARLKRNANKGLKLGVDTFVYVS